MKGNTVYMAVSADFFHDGHRKMIEHAAAYGEVLIGLFTDQAIAAYQRPPITDYETRKLLFSSIRGVSAVVPQLTLDYTDNLKTYRPDYVIHGDDWRTGFQSRVRAQVLETLKEWGGELIEVPYSDSKPVRDLELRYEARVHTTENRRAGLRRLLGSKSFIRGIEVSNGLSALIAGQARYEDHEALTVREFDVLWLSSLCDSAWKGKPDTELVDITSRLHTINEIMEVSSKPIIFDGDTGGKTEHFVYNIKTLERLGVSAIIIEDKKGLKQNSLLDGGVVHVLEDRDVFAGKIRAGKAAQVTRDFMIFARLESLIAGTGEDDAWERANAYLAAGADGIMIHSKRPDGRDVLSFMKRFRAVYRDVPVVLIPTAYHQYSEQMLHEQGADIIIYANHLLRSAYPAMVKTAAAILADGCAKRAADSYCMPISEVTQLISQEYSSGE